MSRGSAEGAGAGDLCYPADVLFSVFRREAQVLVQAEANIVAVKPVASEALLQQMLFECGCDRRLAGSRETGEPDRAAFLLAECAALLARKASVPGNVAGSLSAKQSMLHRSSVSLD